MAAEQPSVPGAMNHLACILGEALNRLWWLDLKTTHQPVASKAQKWDDFKTEIRW